MRAAAIVGDWGTSNLRLFLCSADGIALERMAGPGAAAVNQPFPLVLSALVAEWQQAHGTLPIVLCGMVGSSIGWTQVPYLPCPASCGQIAAHCRRLEGGRVRIVPGLSCTNRLDAPDMMRGEETQLVGALQIEPALASGERLLCFPGTHTKWVTIKDGVVIDFLTAPTGELFALLARHSVLVSDARDGAIPPIDANDAAFLHGLEQVQLLPAAGLLHRLFQCRSRRLGGELATSDAPAFLSGLLTGSDVRGALQLMARGIAGGVHVIGSAGLAQLYVRALSAFGAAAQIIDGEAAARAGLMHILQTR